MSNTLIRVALVSCVITRNGERATVQPQTPFAFTQAEVNSIAGANPNYLRSAQEHEARGALNFENLKDRKPLKGAAGKRTRASDRQAAPEQTDSPESPAAHTREDLETRNVADLQAIATDLGVEFNSRTTKAELIEAIESAAETDSL